MVKHTQTIRRLLPMSVFDHFMRLAFKGLNVEPYVELGQTSMVQLFWENSYEILSRFTFVLHYIQF